MESRPFQNNETEITENCIHGDEEEVDQDGRFLSREELEENQKVREMLLKFLNAKSANKSELRKSLFNIAGSLMKLLAILEDTPNQETTVCRSKTRANHRCDENNKFSSKDQNIPKKINRHLGPKNDGNDEQIPRVTLKRVSSNNKPGYVAHFDKSLYENEECRINIQKPDSDNSQYIPLLQEYAAQTLLQKDEICNAQLNNETEIVFECKNVEPTITSFAPQKLDCLSQNQLQDSEIGEATQKLNSNNDYETNGENEIIPPVNLVHNNEESEKLETCSKKLEKNSNRKVHQDTSYDHITQSCDMRGKKFTQKTKLAQKDDYLINQYDSVHNVEKSDNLGTGGKGLRQKVALKKHIDKARRSIIHTCDSCGKTFKRKSSLMNHIDFVHQNINHHKCDRCPKEFSSKGGLNLHISTKGHLRVHINIKHMSNGKLFKCDQCEKSFNYKFRLTFHINNVHKDIAHPCDLCEKVFVSKTGLKLHKDAVHQEKYLHGRAFSKFTKMPFIKV
ncbi:zinc finger protein 182-like [Trichogramma pretiosum]|uniref:zinc finger protein 182-like n=1 Tax=Trichogramma pretiosum TaxID=7493 RepID=UPI0006C9CA8C|nr:zinc finger protein 182-like [Trichogramma pretiosum]